MQKLINGVEVDCTQEEVAQRQADDAAWEARAAERELAAIERASGMTRRERELAIAALPEGHFWRKKAEVAEKSITELNVRK